MKLVKKQIMIAKLVKKRKIAKVLKCRKEMKQRGMILSWENGVIVSFKFIYESVL